LQDVNNNKKTICRICLFVALILILFAIPLITNRKIQKVDYGTFLAMLDDGKIKEVEILENKIIFSPMDESDDMTYITRYLFDANLVSRIESSKAKFAQGISRIYKEISPYGSTLLKLIMPIMGMILLLLMITGMLNKMGGSGAKAFGKSNVKVYESAQTMETFADVAGQDEAKESLKEIVDFLHNPDKYSAIGAKLPKGALLIGPPGTGKTLLAKAVAGEGQVPFFSISGSEFVEMYVGVGAARVRDLFKQAYEKAPCIVFIDEIDAIGKKRNESGDGNGEREQTLNQLLSEMDGFDGRKGVVILAATNRPDALDNALLRAGRFDRLIQVELPDLKDREAILKVHAEKINVSSDINYNMVARSTSGASGAELANIVNEAALLAVKSGREEVVQCDFEEAVEIVTAGYKRKNAVISEKEKQVIAYHEIGHALVAAKLKHTAPVHKITIVPRTSGALGYTIQVSQTETVLMTKEEIIDKITTFTGGRAAEEIKFNSITSGASNDIEQATKYARSMVTRFGMNEEFDMMALETVKNRYLSGESVLACSEETASKVDSEVLNIIKGCHKKAKEILNDNLDKLNELTKYLLDKETITGEEFMSVLEKGDIQESLF